MSKAIMFLQDGSGTTAIEYSLIAAGISVVIIATVNAIRREPERQVQQRFNTAEIGSLTSLHGPGHLKLLPLRRFLFDQSVMRDDRHTLKISAYRFLTSSACLRIPSGSSVISLMSASLRTPGFSTV